MPQAHHVYLIPGMFGFGRLAGYEYFGHVEHALAQRLSRAELSHRLTLVATPPTASIRRRARVVAETVRETLEPGSVVHLVGHSTGGLDARLLATPSVDLEADPSLLEWRKDLRSVVTVNTPHYGTPLAQFFATVSGTRLLYALSLMSVGTLSLGGPPLALFSNLVAALGKVDQTLGLDVKLLDRATDYLLRYIGDQSRQEVHQWLDGILRDQGSILQITPEAMDVFNASTEDAQHVRYGCLATASPPPVSMRFVSSLRSPYAAVTGTIYSTVYTIASRPHRHYPYPTPDRPIRQRLEHILGEPLSMKLNDGIIPTMSMLWGELLWCGAGDHLDVVGHFQDDQKPARHTDWVVSGAQLTRARFDSAMDAIASFILRRE